MSEEQKPRTERFAGDEAEAEAVLTQLRKQSDHGEPPAVEKSVHPKPFREPRGG